MMSGQKIQAYLLLLQICQNLRRNLQFPTQSNIKMRLNLQKLKILNPEENILHLIKSKTLPVIVTNRKVRKRKTLVIPIETYLMPRGSMKNISVVQRLVEVKLSPEENHQCLVQHRFLLVIVMSRRVRNRKVLIMSIRI